jgi:hypothetical protein
VSVRLSILVPFARAGGRRAVVYGMLDRASSSQPHDPHLHPSPPLAMSLVLPAPVNVHEQEHLPVGGAPAAEEVDDANLPESERLKKTLIYPPPEIRSAPYVPPACLKPSCPLPAERQR